VEANKLPEIFTYLLPYVTKVGYSFWKFSFVCLNCFINHCSVLVLSFFNFIAGGIEL